MADDTWKTTFKVITRLVTIDDGDIGSRLDWAYDVINIHNDVTVGSYKQESYAIKQARRKYKKLVKLMEKTFMSLA